MLIYIFCSYTLWFSVLPPNLIKKVEFKCLFYKPLLRKNSSTTYSVMIILDVCLEYLVRVWIQEYTTFLDKEWTKLGRSDGNFIAII